jgi:hypothetical protein
MAKFLKYCGYTDFEFYALKQHASLAITKIVNPDFSNAFMIFTILAMHL